MCHTTYDKLSINQLICMLNIYIIINNIIHNIYARASVYIIKEKKLIYKCL